ncbi:hypothetical protein [Poseidonocella sp. HB161398]|uniref:hypothetical protein n=1 Tax=Poseidonocella sp. HB161398 TaxID=2320855 RepID=UPI00110954FA|nr:hypothetical protein [Poseidonocella sp. HB161398]
MPWLPIAEGVDFAPGSFMPAVGIAVLQQAIVTSRASGTDTFDDLIAASKDGKLSSADQNAIARAFADGIAAQEGVDWIAVPAKGWRRDGVLPAWRQGRFRLVRRVAQPLSSTR